MTISTTQLITRLRTWALVAGLTGLMIALGALIGGAFLWLFVAIAVGFNLVGYFYSDKIALRAARARPLRRSDAPAVYETVSELASRARIEMPRLYVMPGEQPQCVRDRAQPKPRRDRDDRRAADRVLARSCPRRARPRARAYRQSRHPRVLDHGDDRGRDLRNLERARALVPVRLRRGGQPARHARVAGRAGARADRGDAAAARRLAPAGIPRRRDRGPAAR